MFIIRWICLSLAIVFIAWILPGIEVDNFYAAMFACLIIGLINLIIKPVILLLTLPLNVLTLGLFTFIVNAFLFMFAAYLTPGFEVEGFFSALLGSMLLSVLSMGVHNFGRDK